MNSWWHSLYVRLILALLLGLSASFGTMYLLFQNHLQGSGESNTARIISAQIKLIEVLLQSRTSTELPALSGLRIAEWPSVVVPDNPHQIERASRIRQHLADELARPVMVNATSMPNPGLWIDLHPSGKPTQWLFLPSSNSHRQRDNSLAFSMLVGFFVFFAGGILLLWQIQRPLKKLSRALETVGQSHSFETLPVVGGGITKTLSLRYNNMVHRLNQLEDDRSIMLAGIAHDLRTPITRLRLLTELAKTNRSADFTHNLNNVEHIIEQFLAYARGSDTEHLEMRDLGSFVDEVAATYVEQGVEILIGQDEYFVMIRPVGLRRALVNVIENAIEYGAFPITIKISEESDEVSIVIKDRGMGIPDNKLTSAMRPFSRLDPSRGGQGHCGLGLVIVKKISEEHGGKFILSNRDGGGLIAKICLPKCSSTTSLEQHA